MDLPIMTVEEFIAYKAAQREQVHLAEAYYRVDAALVRERLRKEREQFWADQLKMERFCDAMEKIDRMQPRGRKDATHNLQDE